MTLIEYISTINQLYSQGYAFLEETSGSLGNYIYSYNTKKWSTMFAKFNWTRFEINLKIIFALTETDRLMKELDRIEIE